MAICRAMQKQKDMDRKGIFSIGSISSNVGDQERNRMLKEAKESADLCHKGEDDSIWWEESSWKEAFDDNTGEKLDVKEVTKARLTEMTYFRSRRVYTKVPLEECKRVTGRAPIGVRWLDVLKGDGTYRSRLVAKEFNRGKEEGIFAATPPL